MMATSGSETLRIAAFRAGAGAVLLLTVAAIVLGLAGLAGPYAEDRSVRSLVEMALAYAASLTACGIGFAVVWRAAHRPGARALTWFLAFLALFWASVYLAVSFDGDAPGAPAWLASLLKLNGLIIHLTLWLTPAAFLHFSAQFPRPLEPGELRLAPAASPAAGPARLRSAAAHIARLVLRPIYWLRRRLLSPRRVWVVAIVAGSLPLPLYLAAAATGVESLSVGDGSPLLVRVAVTAVALLTVFFVLFGAPAAIALSALNLRLSYRLADADDRRRIRWIVDGCVLGVVALLSNAVLQVAFDLMGFDHPVAHALPQMILSVGVLVMVICLAVGVFYDGALDSTLIVRRSAVYTGFGVLLTFIFAGVENLVSSHVSTQLGLPDGASSFVAGGSAALAFGALRKTVHRLSGRVTARDRAPAVASSAAPPPAP
ncbi:MAG TPA: hypothetical protein VF158_06805 [Longimicrobiales bacterium]